MTGSSSHVAEGRESGSESSMLDGWKGRLACGVRSPGNRSPAGCRHEDEDDGRVELDEPLDEEAVGTAAAAPAPCELMPGTRLIRLPLDPETEKFGCCCCWPDVDDEEGEEEKGSQARR